MVYHESDTDWFYSYLEGIIFSLRNETLYIVWMWLRSMFFCIKKDLISVLSNCYGLIKDTKRTRGRLDRNVAPCSRPTTTVIGPLHECKKVCPCTKALPHSGIRAWIKQGRKKRKKRLRETGKTEDRRLMERKSAQQNKNTSEEVKQGLPT